MPIYEYHCADCQVTFERLRPMSKAEAPTSCSSCGSSHTSRAISLFAAISKSGNGETRSVAGTGHGCASCGTRQCATCSH